MPAFNISCNRKYLVSCFGEWAKTNSFREAVKLGSEFRSEAVIYERLGKGKRADWFALADIVDGKAYSLILGDLPRD